MPKSDETKHFGDWITTDGLNNKNINERENKGVVYFQKLFDGYSKTAIEAFYIET